MPLCLGPGGIASAGKPHVIGLLHNLHHTIKELRLARVSLRISFPKRNETLIQSVS
jgi:hypothetical protein